MAGGGAPVQAAKGGKKSVDFTVNLIPFIDLLSVLISFLLMTAVWTQLARINTDQAVSQNTTPLDTPPEKVKKLNILVTEDETVMNVTGEQPPTRVPRQPEEQYAKTLRTNLNLLKERLEANPKVTLTAEDKVAYTNLIRVMDICIDVGLSGITVANPAAVQGELL